MNLYELSKDYRDAIDQYNDSITEEEQTQALSLLEKIDETFEEKMGNLYRIHRNYETEVSGYQTEIDRFIALKELAERKDQRLKVFAKTCLEMSSLPVKSVSTELGKVRIQANGGKRSVVVTIDPSMLPPEYRITVPVKYEVDGDAIRMAAEAGAELPAGVVVEPRGTHLRFA